MPWNPRRPRRGHYAPLLIPVLDAFDILGVGVTKGYELVNTREIETVLIGRRRYATCESVERLATPADRQAAEPPEALIASLPPIATPTMAKAEHDRWSGRGKPRAKPQRDGRA